MNKAILENLKELKNKGSRKVRLVMYNGRMVEAVAEFMLVDTADSKGAILKSGRMAAYLRNIIDFHQFDSFSAYAIDNEDTRGC